MSLQARHPDPDTLLRQSRVREVRQQGEGWQAEFYHHRETPKAM